MEFWYIILRHEEQKETVFRERINSFSGRR
jgi:hypothetical protein